jgi:uncharacterized protein YegP (UPF0339 family)
MAGLFEVFVDGESQFRFRLKAPDGTVLAVSAAFGDKAAAAAGIAAVRECAGMGLVTDLCPAGLPARPAPAAAASAPAAPASAVQAHDDQQMPVRRVRAFAHASALRRPLTTPRWTGAA